MESVGVLLTESDTMFDQQVLDALTAIGATKSYADDGMVRLELPVPTKAIEDSPLYMALRTVAIDHAGGGDSGVG